jgi:hypothetical protein
MLMALIHDDAGPFSKIGSIHQLIARGAAAILGLRQDCHRRSGGDLMQ